MQKITDNKDLGQLSDQVKDNLIAQMKDISEQFDVSDFPPAPIWIILFGALAIALVYLLMYLLRRRAYRKSWRYHADSQLDMLERSLSYETAHASAVQLSEIIRRITIKRHGRGHVHLSGNAWLEWLSEKDPRNFDWNKKGQVIIKGVFAPEDRQSLEVVNIKNIRELIAAIRRWVR